MPGYLTKGKAERAARGANIRAERQGIPGRVSERDIVTMFDFFGWRCIYCGGDGLDTTDRVIGLDHVVPMCKGGANELRNIICCCKPCNTSKSRYDVYRWMVKKNLNTQRFQDLFKLWQVYLDGYRPE